MLKETKQTPTMKKWSAVTATIHLTFAAYGLNEGLYIH